MSPPTGQLTPYLELRRLPPSEVLPLVDRVTSPESGSMGSLPDSLQVQGSPFPFPTIGNMV